MKSFIRSFQKNRLVFLVLLGASALAGLLVVQMSCSGMGSPMSTGGTGTINVSLTDPPTCAVPNGPYEHVYVTIRSVQANISSSAGDGSSGWQELAPQLNSQPMQIDLFAAGSNSCLLTSLGSNTALPVGTYQQIRLILVPNDGSGGAVPSSNACGDQGYNCVILQDSSIHELQLSSQANTGLKIPPGQVEGGPITVSPGQDVDLDIDFDACRSIIQEGNGEYRLKPVLTAGQVGTNKTGISGQVVDSATGMPILGGTTVIALEQPDSTGDDVIFMQTAADSSGNFNFCPLPAAATFDVVAVAVNGAGLAYNATVAAGVPGGTNLGAIPLFAETGTATGPTTLQGFVTATTGSAAATIDASVFALQNVSLGGMTRPVSIPAEGASTVGVTAQSNASCPATAPLNSNCAQYTLIEPASNPSVGVFSAGKINYAPPATGAVLYSVRADAFVPMGGGAVDCSPSSITVTQDSSGNPLKAVAGATVVPKEIDFSGCS